MGKLLVVAVVLSLMGCVGFTPPAQLRTSSHSVAAGDLAEAQKSQLWPIKNGRVPIARQPVWCGVTVWAVLPIPLKLPVCVAQSELEIVDGQPRLLHQTRYENQPAYVCGPGAWWMLRLDEQSQGGHFCGALR